MYDALLFLHFIGLGLGTGTGVFLAVAGRQAARHPDAAAARALMPGINAAISGVGKVGLLILFVSGVVMAVLLGHSGLPALFWGKMILVGLLGVFLIIITHTTGRVRNGDAKAVMLMKRIASLGPILAALTILAAVMTFH